MRIFRLRPDIEVEAIALDLRPLTAVIANDDGALYRIRVEGRLGAGWADRTGLAVSVQEGGTATTTELTGRLADEAALMGILGQLYSLGAHLLSVERILAAPHEGGDREPT